MLKLKKIFNERTKTYDIAISDGDNELNISYKGNYDLYFDMINYKNIGFENSCPIEITIPSESDLYYVFDSLYTDVKEGNVYKRADFGDYDNVFELEKLIEEHYQNNKEIYYKKLPFENGEIIWLDDDNPDDKSDSLVISKNEEGINIKMIPNLFTSSFGKVRISNSGSKYSPFNLIFMRFFEDLQQYESSKQKLFKR